MKHYIFGDQAAAWHKLNDEEVKQVCSIIYDKMYIAFPEEFHDILKNGTYIAGGLIRSLKRGKTIPGDVDIYFRTKEYCDQFYNLVLKYKTDAYKPLIGPNNVYLDVNYGKHFHSMKFIGNAMPIRIRGVYISLEFVHKFIGEPLDTVLSFDFNNCMGYYDPKLDYLLITKEMISSLKYDHLIFNEKISSAVFSLKRLKKFLKNGWNISNSELLKLTEAAANSTESDKMLFKAGSGKYSSNND